MSYQRPREDSVSNTMATRLLTIGPSEALQEAAQKLAEAVYAQATAQQASTGGNGADGAETSDDEVIEDAEIVDEKAKSS